MEQGRSFKHRIREDSKEIPDPDSTGSESIARSRKSKDEKDRFQGPVVKLDINQTDPSTEFQLSLSAPSSLSLVSIFFSSLPPIPFPLSTLFLTSSVTAAFRHVITSPRRGTSGLCCFYPFPSMIKRQSLRKGTHKMKMICSVREVLCLSR